MKVYYGVRFWVSTLSFFVKDLGVILGCSSVGYDLGDTNHDDFAYDSTSYLFRMERTSNISVNLRPQVKVIN